ncbi:alpha-amylase family glycosyl hydrolase [Herbiconiux solani]|uniref:alpha-amylase family glycosyl hydrolase n=1 Tax=Herbiconiux solani TaxID=661329 RepID=UPI000826512F|nr:alpha-amylase family glycosyl hydrolase [Herbiconiux solani]
MNDWTEHVIWWHVYPLGFTGADTTGRDRTAAPRLRQLEGWLDHLIALGANGLALGPVFASSTHGYDTTDWFEVDPRLGTTDDLVHLIEAAHARGIRVMLDGVFNHVGREHPFVQAALADPAAPEAAFLRAGENGEFGTFEGHEGLVALDHGNPEVERLVGDVMTYWLRLGADAWRLDAAYSVPGSFWAAVLPRVRSEHPDVYVVGEVLHGDYVQAVTEGTLDSVTQYELWQGIWHSLQTANLFELDWALTRHDGFLEHFVPYTFVGNHDVTRLASAIDDERHQAHAVVLLATLGGTPAVYYGDEFGLRGIKEERFGGDDAIRPAFPADPLAADGPGSGARAAETFALHQELFGLRRRFPWLHRATSRTLSVANESLVIELTAAAAPGEAIVVALNISDAALEVAEAGKVLAGRSIDQGEARPGSGASNGGVTVGPHGWLVATRA